MSISQPVAGIGADLFASRRPKLLLVDDQPINIQVLYQAFSADYDVCMATSGEQALIVCASQKPDLVLLDVEMPGMDGFEVCARLKTHEATRDIPVIFVTAHVDEISETRGLDVGAVDFIYKPINAKIVRARVKTHITLKAQSDLLRNWVYIDGLTNVHNRRCFDERLQMEWKRAVRCDTELSLILIDVDFFKKYNDSYSHQEGDNCLRQVASTLKAFSKRPGDLVARYGGEEFVCLLPETNLKGAAQCAELFRQQVMNLGIEHPDSSVSSVVTISLGVCSKSTGISMNPEELLRQADLQLYRAKELGRNQVCAKLLHPSLA